jgi:hypothetical protein
MRCGNRTPTGRSSVASAAHAGIKTRIGNHTFRATGITAYLKRIRVSLLAANDEALMTDGRMIFHSTR